MTCKVFADLHLAAATELANEAEQRPVTNESVAKQSDALRHAVCYWALLEASDDEVFELSKRMLPAAVRMRHMGIHPK